MECRNSVRRQPLKNRMSIRHCHVRSSISIYILITLIVQLWSPTNRLHKSGAACLTARLSILLGVNDPAWHLTGGYGMKRTVRNCTVSGQTVQQRWSTYNPLPSETLPETLGTIRSVALSRNAMHVACMHGGSRGLTERVAACCCCLGLGLQNAIGQRTSSNYVIKLWHIGDADSALQCHNYT
jgi:hypothetical protein